MSLCINSTRTIGDHCPAKNVVLQCLFCDLYACKTSFGHPFDSTYKRSECLQPQRIVLPEAMDARVLKAAEEVTARGLAKIILLGDPKPVRAEAHRLGIDISQVCTCAPKSSRCLPTLKVSAQASPRSFC